ncbi:MAG: TSUP family transporter [Gammaproteobacteria bacterium]|nr:TSUP family transporter [Gammaproteobacteria bacterium]MDH5583736.1 TSUP family transporter [Gammaproteobacteria bacterium]
MDFTLYWFMFPVSICVATSAMLSGIGGAALFTPIFVLIFPMLGPQYALATTMTAIGAALLTETFGFTSGFVGYYRRKLINFGLAKPFLGIAVPIAILGAIAANHVPGQVLIAGYAGLVLVLAFFLIFHEKQHVEHATLSRGNNIATATGAFMTGMVSVGIGEVIVSQLTKRGIPVGVAAATSVLVVIITVAFASLTLVLQIIQDGGANAMPWNLVCWSIPGVIIGGQIGPLLQGKFSQRGMELSIATLFFVLSIAMFFVAFTRPAMAEETITWPNGATVAVSLSYDDALDSQLDHAIPALNKYSINASFYLTLAHPSVYSRLPAWRAAAAAGHELGNHTIYHGCSAGKPGREWVAPHLDLDKRTVADVVAEVTMANTMLHAIDGRESRTYTPPCSDEMVGGENYLDVVAPMFVAMKSRDEGMPTGSSLLFFPSGNTGAELIRMVTEHRQSGALVNLLFHGVGGDHLSVTPEAHEELLQYLATNRDIYWVDSYINIMSYVRDQRSGN